MRQLGLRLIDSNFPVLGLGPPLCCVYVAPLPAGSIRSLLARSRFGLRLCRSIPIASHPDAKNVIETHEHAGDFKEP